jgi:hypothetical protein
VNRFAQVVIVAVALVAASPLAASARNIFHTHYAGCGHDAPPPPPPSETSQVPELDPNAAAAAFTLLIGGALLINDRRRRFVR